MKPVVGQYLISYLPLSQTFIYEYLKNMRGCKSIVISHSIENFSHFPFKPVYTLPKRQWPESLIARFKWKIKRKFYYQNLDSYEAIEKEIVQQFIRIIIKKRVELLHAHFGPQGYYALKIKEKCGIPLITTFYGYDMSLLPKKDGWLERYKELFSCGDLFLVEGNNMKKGLIGLGCPSEKIKIQHIAADVDKFRYIERRLLNKNDTIKILFCGRFTEKKGLIYALEAIKLLVNKFSKIEFRVIGDGELRREVSDYISENNLDDYVTLLGYQPHSVFTKEAKDAHILLQPSVTAKDGDSEGGAPTVLLEAQSSGLPIVSTCHADIPEVVLDGKSGFLVPERDSLALAEKLEYLIKHPEIWTEMGRKGRVHVEESYNIRNLNHQLVEVYQNLIQGKSANYY